MFHNVIAILVFFLTVTTAFSQEIKLPPTSIFPIMLRIGERVFVCDRPIRSYHDDIAIGVSNQYHVYSFSVPGATVELRHESRIVTNLGSMGTKHRVVVTPAGKITEDCTVVFPFTMKPYHQKSFLFTPMKNGVGMISDAEKKMRDWYYYMTGPQPTSQERLLAIPMIDLYSKYPANSKSRIEYAGSKELTDTSARLLCAADPFYSTLFRVRDDRIDVEWVYEGSKIPFDHPIERTYYTIPHSIDAEEALELFWKTLFVSPSPEWLHNIAMIGYDYLSDAGQGWFNDIDWLEKNLTIEDRGKVCLTLHGWYDILGRYTFDAQKQALDEEWTAFPNAPNCDKAVFPNSVSVKMSQREVIRRLRYAKERGFRVLMYFADGMAICEGAKDEYAPDKILYHGGWQGPDTLGATHNLNPLHPDVYRWFKDYMNALLRTYGNEVDGFVWDETFHVDPSHYGTEYAPGYASTAMMKLTEELATAVHRFRSDCVFLTSDCIGANQWYYKAPYSLMADGTYQDSHCQPAAWPYGIFPNYKNVLWSCNWNAIKRFDWTEIGVRQYQTPVVFTNGWNDDMGFSEMPEETAQKFIQLFHERKQARTKMRWIESMD